VATAAVLAASVAGAAGGAVPTAGTYAGTTAQGQRIAFTVSAEGRTLKALATTLVARCGGTSRTQTFRAAGPAAVGADGSFVLGTALGRLSGKLGTGTASGTLSARWRAGKVRCSVAGVRWSVRSAAPAAPATPAAPAPAPPPPAPPAPPPPPAAITAAGKYCGFTLQSGKGFCFDVAADGRSITELRFEYISSCGLTDGGYYVVTFELDERIALRDDRTFVHTFTAEGLTGSTIQGSFDTNGNASGRFQVHATFDQDGSRFDCPGEGVDWTVKRQG
jgi:hypothetical protein